MASASGLRAVVVGGTGGIGRFILGELVCSPAYTEVLSLCRKETTLPESFNATESDLKKLKQEIIDFDLEKLTVENCKSYFEGKDVLFVALSRTWNDSKRLPGRAIDNFKHVHVHLVVRCAEIAKAAGVRHVSMLSFSGANSTSMFDMMKVKGEADDAVEALGFERTSIWKPSLVNKGPNATFVEKLLKIFMKTIFVGDLGLTIRFESEQWALGKTEFPPVSRHEVRDILEIMRQAKEAEAKSKDNSDVPVAAAGGNETGEKQAADEQMGKQPTGQQPDCDQGSCGVAASENDDKQEE